MYVYFSKNYNNYGKPATDTDGNKQLGKRNLGKRNKGVTSEPFNICKLCTIF